MHYLDAALHQNRMGPAALRAMMDAIKEAEPMARRALILQVRPAAMSERAGKRLAPRTGARRHAACRWPSPPGMPPTARMMPWPWAPDRA